MSATDPSVEQLAARYLAAWHRHDVEDILALHTQDTVFTSIATGRCATGRKAVREALQDVLALWPDIVFRPRRVYTSPDLIVFESTAEVTQAAPLVLGDTVIEPTGDAIAFDLVDILPLQDGLIRRKDVYFDALSYERRMRESAA